MQGLRGLVLALSLVLCAPGWAARHHSETVQGTVSHVSDGDTFVLQRGGGREALTVRVAGLDAPEICQPGGREARAALAGRVLGQRVQLRTVARDRYGRVVARVQWQGQDVGAWLVERGQAWSYGWRGRAAAYAEEQSQAQRARRGLWAHAAIAPRDFRKSHGSCARRAYR